MSLKFVSLAPLTFGLALMLGSGCVRRVPDSIIDKLPYEARIELLEAENDLALAVDRLDEAQNEVLRTRELIHRAKDRLKAANGEVSNAADALSREVAELAVVEGDARVEYLKAKQRLNVKEDDLAKSFLKCGYKRFEQSRLMAARKAKLEGSESLDPADFEADVKKCDEEYAAEKAAMKETEGEATALRASWDETKEKLAKKTFDARASPYVE
jgi:hypothetical protein